MELVGDLGRSLEDHVWTMGPKHNNQVHHISQTCKSWKYLPHNKSYIVAIGQMLSLLVY